MVTRKRRGTLQTTRRSTSPSKALHSIRGADVDLPMTPSRIALPASPARLLSSAISRIRPDMGGVVVNMNRTAEQLGARRDEALTSTKKVQRDPFTSLVRVVGSRIVQFMSNSPNIATLSVIWDLVVLLYTFIPTVTREVSCLQIVYALLLLITLSQITFTVPGSSITSSFVLRHPPAAVFFSKDLYALVLQWAVPTLFLPFVFGFLISFRGRGGVDPISSGIVRLVCAVSSSWGVPDSLLSQKTRIISAATALSFAVAEALSQPEQRMQPKTSRRLLTES